MEHLKEQLRVYAVTDEREDTESLLRTVEQAVRGGAATVQLRRKQADGGNLVRLGRRIREITRRLGALYIVNDRIDVALLTDADGVHVGQSDISCKDARRLVGNGRIVGVSARTLEEAIQAVEDGADYLGVGSIFPTSSKSDAELCGTEVLRQIVQRVKIPTVAIGGITLENVSQVLQTGADGVAVVSAIMSSSQPREAARRFFELF